MTLPRPRPGLIIRHAFLWDHERTAGRDEAAKARPCAIVVATETDRQGEIRVIVAPITHSPPDDPAGSLEIPPDVAAALGLDGDRAWLRCDQINRFTWPGFDLRPLPGKPGVFHYGMLPRGLFEALRQGILALDRRRKLAVIDRDDAVP